MGCGWGMERAAQSSSPSRRRKGERCARECKASVLGWRGCLKALAIIGKARERVEQRKAVSEPRLQAPEMKY